LLSIQSQIGQTEPVELSLPKSFIHAKKISCTRPDQIPNVKVSKLVTNAIVPAKATPGSAGFDIFAYEDSIIPPNGRSKISTKTVLSIPVGYYGRMALRSGLSLTHNIGIGAGVIDSDYRREIYPVLINNSTKPFQVKRNTKIAQIVIARTDTISIEELDDLDITKRGIKGFGSTDKQNQTNTDDKRNSLSINKIHQANIKLP